ncbi:predicted protein [Lichtheimia corymbifera JMRC:FSU:9682]|uniref:Uncharacterized protein n=1 Tax=Lichtheimia corymbifera JMRC:FSU:9682 TaxID=1263082 RepID=A0A068RW21_9FUNG|nr:predicted protein [Lichtheimia corymbifera JMRC:FSU:9682]
MSPPASSKKNSRGRPDQLWLVVTLGESENGHDDRETSTQGAFHPTAQLCSIEDRMFHCEVLRYRLPFMFYICCNVMLYDKWSLFIAKSLDPNRTEGADGLLCATQLICMILHNEQTPLSI